MSVRRRSRCRAMHFPLISPSRVSNDRVQTYRFIKLSQVRSAPSSSELSEMERSSYAERESSQNQWGRNRSFGYYWITIDRHFFVFHSFLPLDVWSLSSSSCVLSLLYLVSRATSVDCAVSLPVPNEFSSREASFLPPFLPDLSSSPLLFTVFSFFPKYYHHRTKVNDVERYLPPSLLLSMSGSLYWSFLYFFIQPPSSSFCATLLLLLKTSEKEEEKT